MEGRGYMRRIRGLASILGLTLTVAKIGHFLLAGGLGLVLAGAGTAAGYLLGFPAPVLVIAAAGVFLVASALILELVTRSLPLIEIGPATVSSIEAVTEKRGFGDGLLVNTLASAAASVVTVSGKSVSEPATMILVRIGSKYGRGRDSQVTPYVECLSEDREESTRPVVGHWRDEGAGPKAFGPTGDHYELDTVMKVTSRADSSVFTPDGAGLPDLSINDHRFVLRVTARGKFKPRTQEFLVTHKGADSPLAVSALN